MRQPVWFACGDTGLLLDFQAMAPLWALRLSVLKTGLA